MPDIQIIPAKPCHIKPIAERIGKWDAIESLAFGFAPRVGLRISLTASTHAWTALVDGKPEVVFGVAPVSMMDGRGKPWLLGTDESRKHARAFLIHGRETIAQMMRTYDRLSNLVAARNGAAIRLLKHLGFTIEWDAVEIGGYPFVRFHKER